MIHDDAELRNARRRRELLAAPIDDATQRGNLSRLELEEFRVLVDEIDREINAYIRLATMRALGWTCI